MSTTPAALSTATDAPRDGEPGGRPATITLLRHVSWPVFGLQFLAMAWWSRLQYQRFALTQDAATYIQAFHLLSHGDLAPYASTLGYPFLQNHFELFAWPLSILDRLGPQGVSLLWAQDLFVVAAEVAAFGWMCHVAELYPPREASPFTTRRLLALGLVLLVANPWSYWAISFDVHVETFAAVFIVLAALEFSRGNNRWGWIWAVLTMLCGDVPTTYVAGLGLSALVAVAVSRDRRPARYLNGIGLIAASVTWLACIEVVGGNKGSTVIGLYGYLAVAAGAVVPEHLGLVGLLKGVVRHPATLLAALWHTRLNVFAHLSPAGGFGVITAWTCGVPLVVYVENSLENQKVHFFSFEPFQNFPMVVFCAVGTIVVLAWLAHRHRLPRVGGSVVLAVLMANALAWGAIWIPADVPNWLHVSSAQAEVLARTLREIPPNAEVVVSSGVAGPFANRADILTWQSASEPVAVTGKWVWFVVAPGAGIETIRVSRAMGLMDQLVGRLHARLEVYGNGVYAFRWRRPPGVHTLHFQNQPSTLGAWTLLTNAGHLAVTGPPATWHVTASGLPGYLVYGDYWTEPRGHYLATAVLSTSTTLNFEVWNSTTDTLVARLQVPPTAHRTEFRLPVAFSHSIPRPGSFTGFGPFSATREPPPSPLDELEIRVWAPEGARADVYDVSLASESRRP